MNIRANGKMSNKFVTKCTIGKVLSLILDHTAGCIGNINIGR